MIRPGLCCIFRQQAIKFSTTTAKHVLGLSNTERLDKLSRLCLANSNALKQAFEFCAKNGIGCFRILSQIFPLKTHPQAGYNLNELPEYKRIKEQLSQCKTLLRKHNLRASFHPDQFVVLNSPKPQVVASSIAEIEYQAMVAEMVGADVVNIHGGGAYGNKPSALKRFKTNFRYLSDHARKIVTVENDDRTYTPEDLLELCHNLKIPLVYDVHHHRCLKDSLSIKQATSAALKTWNREPLFHISSPKDGWNSKDPKKHHDYIDLADFPENWKELDLTVEIEAKAKELAVLKLRKELQKQNIEVFKN